MSSTSTSIKLQWSHVNGDAKKTYTVIRNENEVLFELERCEATINGLTPNTNYQFQVKATNDAGDGLESKASKKTKLIAYP